MPEELLDYICSTWEAANPSEKSTGSIWCILPTGRPLGGRCMRSCM